MKNTFTTKIFSSFIHKPVMYTLFFFMGELAHNKMYLSEVSTSRVFIITYLYKVSFLREQPENDEKNVRTGALRGGDVAHKER